MVSSWQAVKKVSVSLIKSFPPKAGIQFVFYPGFRVKHGMTLKSLSLKATAYGDGSLFIASGDQGFSQEIGLIGVIKILLEMNNYYGING